MSGGPSFLSLALAHLDQPLQDTLRSVDDKEALEDTLRFICGAEQRSSGDKWDSAALQRQYDLRKALDAQLKPSELKRRRDDDEPPETTPPKKAKLGGDIVDDGAPLFILHAVSTTAPVRKKVDVVVTAASVKFVNSTSQAVEAVVSLSSLQRAFLLPTRGKTKPHWTVVVLSSDIPDAASPQITFGLDAAAPANLYTTTQTNGEKIAVPKGSETLPILRTLLSHLGPPNPIYETDPKVFKSAASKEPISGTEAYLGAKVGTLWFFADGILWGEAKPCEFWPADAIVDIRVTSATGRQCSATIIRRSEEEDEDGVETEFTFLDGREQDGIRHWVKRYRKLRQGEESEAGLLPVPAGAMTINSLAMMSDDEDEDYSETDDSSDEDTEEEEAEGEGAAEEEAQLSGAEEDDEEDSDADEDDEMAGPDDELDPAHHPLMRPGAMPKMTKAAMDMVVGMMEESLVGGGEEEVDELED